MYGVPPRGYPHDNSNARFFHTKNTMDVSLYNVCRTYMPFSYLALFYQIPHTYGMHMSLEIHLTTGKT